MISPKSIELFLEKVDKTENCWIWLAHRNNKGYGVINISGVKLAHRISWEIYVGNIPKGMVVMHKCDNPICVRPEHLGLGTQIDNLKDMYRKGRAALKERRTQSKLTMKIASKIRVAYKSGHFTQRRLAKVFHISQAIVCDVINNKRWI